uniref:Uncharacterized protein n=1 Tax=Salix viminalis TaxID=40686 RepID=A0A6N2MDB2_SALVM
MAKKCEDALYSLLKLGSRRSAAFASVAMAKIISRGDSISIYSRASSLQGFLSDAKRSEPQRVAGAVRCWSYISILEEKLDFVNKRLYLCLKSFGRSCVVCTTALFEAFRLITRIAIGD